MEVCDMVQSKGAGLSWSLAKGSSWVLFQGWGRWLDYPGYLGSLATQGKVALAA